MAFKETVVEERTKFISAIDRIESSIRYSRMDTELAMLKWLRDCSFSPIYIENKISYVPEGKDEFVEKQRMLTTLKRFLTRQYKSKFETSHLDWLDARFVDLFGAVNFMEVKGADVEKVYSVHEGCYSCMAMTNSPKTRLYTMNPDNIRMVVGYKSPVGTSIEDIGKSKQMFRLLFFFPYNAPNTIVLDRRTYASGMFSDFGYNTKDAAIKHIKEWYPNYEVRMAEDSDRLKVLPPDNHLWPHPDFFEWASENPDSDGKYILSNKNRTETPYPLTSVTGDGPTHKLYNANNS